MVQRFMEFTLCKGVPRIISCLGQFRLAFWEEQGEIPIVRRFREGSQKEGS